MNLKLKTQRGLSALEIAITLGIFSIISVATVGLVFTSLSLRDQTTAVTQTAESVRVLVHTLRQATLNASQITGDTTSLFFTSPTQCWSFVYDSVNKNLRYSTTASPGCVPDPSPSVYFFPVTQQVTGLSFSINQLPTGGRSVSATTNIHTILPFGDYQTSFENTFTNVVD